MCTFTSNDSFTSSSTKACGDFTSLTQGDNTFSFKFIKKPETRQKERVELKLHSYISHKCATVCSDIVVRLCNIHTAVGWWTF